jgi:hypothetical protein
LGKEQEADHQGPVAGNWETKWAVGSLASIAMVTVISALPWLLVAATAVLIALPIPAFTAGKRAGEEAIAGYHAM